MHQNGQDTVSFNYCLFELWITKFFLWKLYSGQSERQSSSHQRVSELANGRVKRSTASSSRVKCQYCPKTYSKLGNLNHHVQVVHKHRSYVCSVSDCLKKVGTRFALKRHMRDVHNINNYRNAFEQEVYLLQNDEIVSERAMVFMIDRLKKENDSQKKLIDQLKRKIIDVSRNRQVMRFEPK